MDFKNKKVRWCSSHFLLQYHHQGPNRNQDTANNCFKRQDIMWEEKG